MHAHTAMYCPVTHNCPLGSKMKISIVIHHHHLIVLSHTYRHAQIPESKQHLQHLATQSFDLGSHPSHSEKKCDSHLPSLVYCLFSKTNLTRSMGFLKKNTPKKQVYGLSLCPSPILKFLCVCVCACIPLCKRVYLYVGHLVAIRVNHPSFLRLAVSHKLT